MLSLELAHSLFGFVLSTVLQKLPWKMLIFALDLLGCNIQKRGSGGQRKLEKFRATSLGSKNPPNLSLFLNYATKSKLLKKSLNYSLKNSIYLSPLNISHYL